MTMRDEYRTKAAEFEARARIESDRTTRLHFESLANDYQCLAELADRNEQIYKRSAAQSRIRTIRSFLPPSR